MRFEPQKACGNSFNSMNANSVKAAGVVGVQNELEKL